MSSSQAGPLRQVKVCFDRCVRGFVNDRGWKTFVSAGIIMVIIGLVMGENTFVSYYPTKNGAFALVCACIWIGIFNSIRSICRERDIVRREHRTGLNLGSYIAAHWLFEAVMSAIEALIATVVVVVMSGDHFIEKAVFLPPAVEVYITFLLIVFSSDALGLLVSSIVRSENTAMTVMPFVLIVQLVMSGFIFELEGATKTISNITVSRWGLDAICASAHLNSMYEPAHGIVVALSEQSSRTSNLLTLWLTLMGFAVIYAILAAVALTFVDEG